MSRSSRGCRYYGIHRHRDRHGRRPPSKRDQLPHILPLLSRSSRGCRCHGIHRHRDRHGRRHGHLRNLRYRDRSLRRHGLRRHDRHGGVRDLLAS